MYNFADPSFSETTGHFTQLVWRHTYQVGCAIGICNSVQAGTATWRGKLYICEYYPPGEGRAGQGRAGKGRAGKGCSGCGCG